MQGNVAEKPRETNQTGNTPGELQETVFNKPKERLFGKHILLRISTSRMIDTIEDGALFNVLPAFDHLLKLSQIRERQNKYTEDSRLSTCINVA
jgi:hypothetical protein